MKSRTFPFYLLFPVAIFFMVANNSSCSSHPEKEFMIQGTVQSIENGKDGYTATLKDDDGNDFDALFSRVTLGEEYRMFTPGERLRVAGDTMHLNNRLHVIVNKINP